MTAKVGRADGDTSEMLEVWLEFDVKGALDNLDHDLLWKALCRHTDCKWVLLMCAGR
jgi:retron-type reverse transcriptase